VEASPGLTVFFRQTVIGEELGNESCANIKPQLGEYVGDLVHVQIGLVALSDDERFDLASSFRRALRLRPFWQQIRRWAIEDGIANIIVGFARFEAECLGQLALWEGGEFPHCDHADLFLDRLIFREGDDIALAIGQHESSVFDEDFDIERNIHWHLPCNGWRP
jgi:hypothetical protein